jgi:prophage antirepressor-like protein
MKTSQTGRQNDQLTPFTYEDRAVRTVLIDDDPWFIAKDVCEVLGIQKTGATFNDFPDSEKGCYTITTPGGDQEMLTVNEPGLYRLIFQSRKPEAERFKNWVFTDVLPAIRKTGGYGSVQEGIDTGEIYSLFSGDPSMTVRRINKLLYYQAIQPPLTNADIAKLLDANESNVSYWRRWVPAEKAREAVKKLRLTAYGSSENVLTRNRGRKALPSDRPGFPLELPAKGAGHE